MVLVTTIQNKNSKFKNVSMSRNNETCYNNFYFLCEWIHNFYATNYDAMHAYVEVSTTGKAIIADVFLPLPKKERSVFTKKLNETPSFKGRIVTGGFFN